MTIPQDPRSTRTDDRTNEDTQQAERALERMRDALQAGRANLDKALENLRQVLRRDDERRR